VKIYFLAFHAILYDLNEFLVEINLKYNKINCKCAKKHETWHGLII
jgi:hypothetical protein